MNALNESTTQSTTPTAQSPGCRRPLFAGIIIVPEKLAAFYDGVHVAQVAGDNPGRGTPTLTGSVGRAA